MGLLDNFGFDPNDPRKAAMMAAAAQLMMGRGNLGQSMGQGLLAGMGAYQNAGLMGDRKAQEAQEREFRKRQMDAYDRQQANETGLSQAARTAFMQPNQNLVANDDMGNAMPQVPGGGGMPEFMRLGAPYMNASQIASFAQKQQPIKMGRDDRLIDPVTHREVLPAAPDRPPTGMRLGAGGQWEYDPAYLAGQQSLAAARRPQVSVNTNMPPLEKKEQQDKGALNVKNFGDLQGAANVARRENALLSGLEKIPLETGALTPANATVSAWVAALGGGEKFKDTASQAQGFTAFAKDLVLQRQLAQKGPQTESDARRLEQTVANLGNTSEANQVITSFSKAVNSQIIAKEKFFNDWWKKNKTYEGADDAWMNGDGGKSVWEDPKLKRFLKSGGTVLRFDRQGNQVN